MLCELEARDISLYSLVTHMETHKVDLTALDEPRFTRDLASDCTPV